MKDGKNTLAKVLGRIDIIAIGFGTMVGWGWIAMSTSWVNEAGVAGSLLAFAIGGMIFLGIGLVYGELTAALPMAGGEFAFVYRAMGKKYAWLVGWMLSLAYLGVAAWEGIALATAIDYIFPLPYLGPLWDIAGYQVYFSWAVVGSAGAAVITLLNMFGVRRAILFQVMSTAALMIIVLIILFGSLIFGDSSNAGKPFVSVEGFSYVLLMVPAMLIGFDVIPQSAEEMNISHRNIGKMIMLCIVLSLIWYTIVIISVSLAAPVEIRASGILPMAEVVSYLFSSNIFSMLVAFGGVFGILTSWNGFFIGSTRLIFAMGRARVLPEVFGKVHKKYKSPWAACLLVGGICIVSPLLGKNALQWFVDTSSMCSLFSYILVLVAYVLLKWKEPELARPFNVKGGVGLGILILAVVCLYFMLYLTANIDSLAIKPEFGITAVWILAGVVLAFSAKKKRNELTREQQELLVFGELFARRGDENES